MHVVRVVGETFRNGFFVLLQDCNLPTSTGNPPQGNPRTSSGNPPPSDWLSSFRIPERDSFSGSVHRAIDTGVITSKARREIVQVLRTLISMHTLYPVSEQYIAVSQKLVTKYPNLRDPIGTNGFVSVRSDFSMSLYTHVSTEQECMCG